MAEITEQNWSGKGRSNESEREQGKKTNRTKQNMKREMSEAGMP